jgi:hypothetical protein
LHGNALNTSAHNPIRKSCLPQNIASNKSRQAVTYFFIFFSIEKKTGNALRVRRLSLSKPVMLFAVAMCLLMSRRLSPHKKNLLRHFFYYRLLPTIILASLRERLWLQHTIFLKPSAD